LLPIASGAGIFLLLGEFSGDDRKLLVPIGIFGAVVTFGLFMYELRGIEDCTALRERARNIEHRLGIPVDLSQFGRWWGGKLSLVDEIGAAWIVYTAVLASWIFVAGAGLLRDWPGWLAVLSGGMLALGFLLVVVLALSPRGPWGGHDFWGRRRRSPPFEPIPDHIALRVADYEATVDWYMSKLGFEVQQRWSSGDMRLAYLTRGDVKVEIIGDGRVPDRPAEVEDLDNSFGRGGYHHLCLAVDDLDSFLAELERNEVTVLKEPFVVQEIHRRLAFIKDCNGNLIELAAAY
jgi:catechol 2,3-dioxygenase-like lactoylglutathione lyase family enzyme